MSRQFLFGMLLLPLLIGCAGTRMRATPQEEAAEAPPDLALSMVRGSVSSSETVEPVTLNPAETEVESNAIEPSAYAYRLQVGDPIVINLRGIYPRDEQVEDVIDDSGNVTLPLLGDIYALGKSTSEMESEIRRLYIDGGYYRNLTVSVIMPQRTYFIRGEVRQAGRFPIVGGLTLMQAIAAAGGYTEFASPRNVQLLRGTGRPIDVNMRQIEKNPETDIRLESGDVIVVGRSMF